MSVACYYTNLINTLLIPQRIERRSHPYQKCALPIKLRNLNYIIKINKVLKINILKILQFKVIFFLFIILRQEHPDLNWKFEV